MKRIILAVDGIADEPLEQLDNKTPLEVAKKPNINALAREGSVGRLRLGESKAFPSEALMSMSLLGYSGANNAARGPLSAAAIELKAASNDWLLACRLVTVLDGKLVDPWAGGIGDRESAALFESLNRAFKARDIRFYSGEPKCHVLSIRQDEAGDKFDELNLTDPIAAVGAEQYGAWSRSGAGARLKGLLAEAAEILETHEVNKVRVDLSENPANALWVWGAGHALVHNAFAGSGRAVVMSSSDAWKGAALAVGIDWHPAFTSSKAEPSDLAELAERFFGLLKTHDCLYLQLPGMDRSALIGDYKKKIRWIEALDQHIVGPLRDRVGPSGRLAIVSGHVTASARRERTSTEAPYLIWGAGEPSSNKAEFTEEAASDTGKAISASEFFKKII
ncbi:MAG: hypothetical protein KBD07_04510 [Candidatus Omnitrophica bacterium]|nr:hypothetical protein [Candidatus Omnitrophota bacterium]